jgi:hypothetical protein
MSTTAIIALVLVVAALLAIGVFVYLRHRRSTLLRSRFGPEYARAVEETGDRSKAEARLERRTERVKKYDIRPLAAETRDRYVAAWRKIQAEFVDNPEGAVTHADGLLDEAMRERGYPVSDFEQRASDLSVEYPAVVQNYRAAHDIALKHNKGEARTEELRRAMLHYRSLFQELVEIPASQVQAAS